MPENKIYQFLKENNLTNKDETTFVKDYADPQKSAELHSFFKENNLTTKSADDFYNEYFSSTVKKNETPSTGSYVRAEPPTQTSASVGLPKEIDYTKQFSVKQGEKGISDTELQAQRKSQYQKQQDKGQEYGMGQGQGLLLSNKKEKPLATNIVEAAPPREIKKAPSFWETNANRVENFITGINQAVTNAPAEIIKTGEELITYGGNKINKVLGINEVKLEDQPLYKVADSYQNWMDKNVYSNANKESTAYGVGSGLGQALTMIGTGGAGATTKALAQANKIKTAIKTSVLPFSQVFNSEYEQMKEKGEDDDTAFLQAISNATVSTPLEKMPIANLFTRYNKYIGSDLTKRTLNALAQSLEESSTEYIQQVFSNLSNNQLVELEKNTKEWYKDAPKSAEVGGIVGMLLGTISGVAQGKLKKRYRPQQEPQPSVSPELQEKLLAADRKAEEARLAEQVTQTQVNEIPQAEEGEKAPSEAVAVEEKVQQLSPNAQSQIDQIKSERANILASLDIDDNGQPIITDEASAKLKDLQNQALNIQQNDSQNITGVSGQVGEGQESVEAKPIEEAGGTPPPSGRMVQTPQQKVEALKVQEVATALESRDLTTLVDNTDSAENVAKQRLNDGKNIPTTTPAETTQESPIGNTVSFEHAGSTKQGVVTEIDDKGNFIIEGKTGNREIIYTIPAEKTTLITQNEPTATSITEGQNISTGVPPSVGGTQGMGEKPTTKETGQEVSEEQIKPTPTPTEEVKEEAKEGFTEGKDLNKMFAEVKAKYGAKKGAFIYDAAIRLANPNKNKIIEIRSNGIVVKQGEKYIFRPFGNTDSNPKNWVLYKGMDISEQFEKPKTEKTKPTETNLALRDVESTAKALEVPKTLSELKLNDETTQSLEKKLKQLESERTNKLIENKGKGKFDDRLKDEIDEVKRKIYKRENELATRRNAELEKSISDGSLLKLISENKISAESARLLIIESGIEVPAEIQSIVDKNKQNKKENKQSIIERDTDFLGNEKEAYMVNNDKANGVRTQDDVDYYKAHVKRAIDKGQYEKDIADGKMTANDAKIIIESYGLKVPKAVEPLLSKEQTPATKTNPALKDVESTAKALESKSIGKTKGRDIITDIQGLVLGINSTVRNIIKNTTPSKETLERLGLSEWNPKKQLADSISQLRNIVNSIPTTTRAKQLADEITGDEKAASYDILGEKITLLTAEIRKWYSGDTEKGSGLGVKEISEAYHKAKADGTNPELVQAVESLLSKEQTPPATDVESTAENNSIIKQNKIEGGLLNEQQSADLQKEIESKYNTVQKFGKENEDIRTNLYNYDNPLAEKDVNGVNLRITEGLIERDKYSGNKRKTYLLYADGKIAGKFYSVADIKKVVKFIEDNLIKPKSLLSKQQHQPTIKPTKTNPALKDVESTAKKTNTVNGYEFTKTPTLDNVIVEPIEKSNNAIIEKQMFADENKNVLSDGVKYIGGGWYEIGGDNFGSVDLYNTVSKEGVSLNHKQGGRMGAVVQDFIKNNSRYNDDIAVRGSKYTQEEHNPKFGGSGHYKGTYFYVGLSAESKALEHGKNLTKVDIGKANLYELGEDGQTSQSLKNEAKKAGYDTRDASGYAESEYLKKQGYDGIKRGNEIVLFEPKKFEVKEEIADLPNVSGGTVKQSVPKKGATVAFVSKYNDNPLQMARREKYLDSPVMSNGKQTTERKLIEERVKQGWRVTKKATTDTAASKKLNQEYERLQRTAPIGNENHPETKRLRELEKMPKSLYNEKEIAVKKEELRLESPEGTTIAITPFGEDYVNELLYKSESLLSKEQTPAKTTEKGKERVESTATTTTPVEKTQKNVQETPTTKVTKEEAGEALRKLLAKAGVIKNIVPNEKSDAFKDIMTIVNYVAQETSAKGKELINKVKKYLNDNNASQIADQVDNFKNDILKSLGEEVKTDAEQIAELYNVMANAQDTKTSKDAKKEITNILNKKGNEKLKFVYMNIAEINKQLEDKGLLTKKGDCP